MNILVIAPHPDDEVLGVGGTIARYAAEGCAVYVAIATQGQPPDFDSERVQTVGKEAIAAHQILGVKQTLFLPFPAARVDTVPHKDINQALVELYANIQPHIIFVPFNGDLHLDHQQVFLSALVAARPISAFAPRTIYAYETLSETNWNAPYLTPGFLPNVFVDISDYLELKLQAMQRYASQLQPFPHERSEATLRALATLRGSTVSCVAAEAFVLIRDIQR